MKSCVVPAQITTVEDRIAGSLTFNQIILLVVPLLTSTVIYVIIAPFSHLSSLKLILIMLQFLFFGIMAIRIKGKILLDWLVIYLRYQTRPRIYVFTKNDQTGREAIDMIKEKSKISDISVSLAKEQKASLLVLSHPDQLKMDKLFTNTSLSIRLGLSKKGGIDVSVTPSKE